ncbi:hypothetical protein ACH4UY_19760 [Streptomyces longwoodensis]|jgi:hypothetical protein|uniref:hypothetical protein n=1 Tax=Streptomyces longwoodensis TaxID=68231 RepID=UPI00378DC2A3
MDRERSHEESVSVEISGCSKEDARVVFDALCACFESDRCAEDVPEQLDESRPMVWLGTFEVSEAHEFPPPARLSSTVTADAQGGYWAIEQLRKVLDAQFSMRDVGHSSGDQEKELHVLLESK